MMACPFHSLVDDVQLYTVTHFLDTPDLLSLAVVSRHWNKITTPVLYKYISLLLRISRAPIQWIPQVDDRPALQRGQRALWETLVSRPELALHVRTLEWQVQWLSEKSWPAYKEDVSVIDRLFDTLFPLLRNVTKLYLIGVAGYCPKSIPAVLFPHVTSIKLGRAISLETTEAILHCPAQIYELSVDTIWPYKPESHVEILRWLAKTPFPALRKLSLRYGPVPDGGTANDPEDLMKIFAAWNDILLSSRRTLRVVLLGFKDPMPGCLYFLPEPGIAPLVESRFIDVVGPAFIKAEWPELRVLELEGAESFPGLWEPLEGRVPRLVRHSKRQLVIETWDVSSKTKF